ncbi:MAG: DUF1080 domain-containing protein [Lentimicrobium sp.]|nr:DUF1080 domain-containing protein [Lentimicrobium sp.]
MKMKLNITNAVLKNTALIFIFLFYAFTDPLEMSHNKALKSLSDYNGSITKVPESVNRNCVFASDTLKENSDSGVSSEWEILFDGKNTDKWKGVNCDTFPSDGWAIEDGALVLTGKNGGDIITKDRYKDFELVLDFKLTPNANSGIKYFVTDVINSENGQVFKNGPEYQIIDDYNHPEVKDHRHEIGSTASLYLIYVPENKILNPAGEWNSAKIVAKGRHVEHWLNGTKVLSYKKGSKDFRKRISTTKFKNQIGYGESESGYILLTDHKDKVYFKNIRIKRL